jgi:hypothetical protein
MPFAVALHPLTKSWKNRGEDHAIHVPHDDAVLDFMLKLNQNRFFFLAAMARSKSRWNFTKKNG